MPVNQTSAATSLPAQTSQLLDTRNLSCLSSPFSGSKAGRFVKVTTHLPPVLRWRMSESVPPLLHTLPSRYVVPSLNSRTSWPKPDASDMYAEGRQLQSWSQHRLSYMRLCGFVSLCGTLKWATTAPFHILRHAYCPFRLELQALPLNKYVNE
jgi:hypothetical protein